jgi:nicotinamidase-related amidase
MGDTVLLVVDMQTALIQGHPYHEEKLITNIAHLISLCREKKIEIVYVRHDGGTGDELEYNSDGWQLYKEIEPRDGEKIFEKHYNSAFKSTQLKQYLDEKKIKNIILVGMQAEYCIDTTCKVAFEYGYHVIIPEGTTSTFDNSSVTGESLYNFYLYNIWKDRFAKILNISELEKELDALSGHEER